MTITSFSLFGWVGASLSLSSSTLSVIEGNFGVSTLPLCVQIQNYMAGLERDITLLLTTTFGTAGIL